MSSSAGKFQTHGIHIEKFGLFNMLKLPGSVRQEVINNSFSFLIVREPFRRLLSAFNDLCHHNAEKVYTFWKKIYRNIQKLHFRQHKNWTKMKITFENFLEYITHPNSARWLNEHWMTYDQSIQPCVYR